VFPIDSTPNRMASRDPDSSESSEHEVDMRESGSGADFALRKRLAEVEDELEELRLVNAGQKAQIDRLQKDRIRKSILPQAPPLVCIEEDVKGGGDPADKLEQFFKIFNTKSISSAQLSVHAINSLISLHQVLYAPDSHSSIAVPFAKDAAKRLSEKASKVAFNYVLEFIRQLNARKIAKKDNEVDLGYPINWLLSLFPYIAADDKKGELKDVVWMPLHFALAMDSSVNAADDEDPYYDDMYLLLEEFGEAAFEEDVSPLSVFVSVPRPNLRMLEMIHDFRPESVCKPDEDGSLPLMHACANNVSLEVIEQLYKKNSEAVRAVDSFGCAAIHYAAFYGCSDTVKYLMHVEPECANMVEGNGALPLHDAAQNQRDIYNTEMVEFLLQVNPDAARKRDDYGAFPLHKAVKSSSLAVVKLIHAAFPKVRFTTQCTLPFVCSVADVFVPPTTGDVWARYRGSAAHALLRRAPRQGPAPGPHAVCAPGQPPVQGPRRRRSVRRRGGERCHRLARRNPLDVG